MIEKLNSELKNYLSQEEESNLDKEFQNIKEKFYWKHIPFSDRIVFSGFFFFAMLIILVVSLIFLFYLEVSFDYLQYIFYFYIALILIYIISYGEYKKKYGIKPSVFREFIKNTIKWIKIPQNLRIDAWDYWLSRALQEFLSGEKENIYINKKYFVEYWDKAEWSEFTRLSRADLSYIYKDNNYSNTSRITGYFFEVNFDWEANIENPILITQKKQYAKDYTESIWKFVIYTVILIVAIIILSVWYNLFISGDIDKLITFIILLALVGIFIYFYLKFAWVLDSIKSYFAKDLDFSNWEDFEDIFFNNYFDIKEWDEVEVRELINSRIIIKLNNLVKLLGHRTINIYCDKHYLVIFTVGRLNMSWWNFLNMQKTINNFTRNYLIFKNITEILDSWHIERNIKNHKKS